jgi:hypothetical protein
MVDSIDKSDDSEAVKSVKERLAQINLKEMGLSPNESFSLQALSKDQLAAICVKVARKYGTKKLLGSKGLYQYEGTEVDINPDEFLGSPYTKRKGKLNIAKPRLEISWLEALSLSWIAHYHYKYIDNVDFLISAQVDDKYKNGTELMLSDGILVYVENAQVTYSHIFQQVMAQNLYGKNKGIDINEELIRQINKKAERRESYAHGCGLIASAVSNGQDIEIERIITESNAEKFYPSYLVVYEHYFSKVKIYPLIKECLDNSDMLDVLTYSEWFKKLPEHPAV